MSESKYKHSSIPLVLIGSLFPASDRLELIGTELRGIVLWCHHLVLKFIVRQKLLPDVAVPLYHPHALELLSLLLSGHRFSKPRPQSGILHSDTYPGALSLGSFPQLVALLQSFVQLELIYALKLPCTVVPHGKSCVCPSVYSNVIHFSFPPIFHISITSSPMNG